MVKIGATLTYQENCDYLSSQVSDKIDIDKQDVDIETSVEIIDYDKREINPIGDRKEFYKNGEFLKSEGNSINYSNGHFNPYYNDQLKFEAKITITDKEQNTYLIKHRDVNIYFFEINEENRTQLDPLDQKHIIAKNIRIDNEGKVGVTFLPHASGYFIVEYNETPYFNKKVVEHKINIEKIPVRTIVRPVISETPIFVHPEESINLMASVRDTYGRKPRDGVITFLRYLVDYDGTNNELIAYDGYERVIGNPVMLEDGETVHYQPPVESMAQIPSGATSNQDAWQHEVYEENGTLGAASGYITYSPRQLDDPNDEITPYNNVEYIRAVYNYENYNYGASWKYYTNSSRQAPLGIVILKPSTLNLSIIKRPGKTGEPDEIDGRYYTHGDTILAYAQLTDDDAKPVNFPTNKEPEVRFKITVVGKIFKSNNSFEYQEYIYDINSRYDTNTKQFILRPEASTTDGIRIGARFESYDEANKKLNRELAEGYCEIEAYIKNSEQYYNTPVEPIPFKNSTDMDIKQFISDLSSNCYYKNSNKTYNDIIIYVTANNNYSLDKIYNNGKRKIYLILDRLGADSERYATLQRDNQNSDKLKAVFKVKDTKNSNEKNVLELNTISNGHHSLVGALKKDENSDILKENLYSEWRSFSICMKPEPIIGTITHKQKMYKGNVDIPVGASNVDDNVNIEIKIKNANTNELIGSYNKTCTESGYQYTINQDNLNSGQYLVEVNIVGESNIISKTFNIEKANLQTQASNVNVITGNNQNVNIKVETDGNIDGVQENNFKILEEVTDDILLNSDTDLINLSNNPKIARLIRVENNKALFDYFNYQNFMQPLGRGYIKEGWINNDMWEVSFKIYNDNYSFFNNGSVYITNASNYTKVNTSDYTWNYIKFDSDYIECTSNGDVYLKNKNDNEKIHISNIEYDGYDDFSGWYGNSGEATITVRKENNHYIILLENAGKSSYFNFDYNIFNEENEPLNIAILRWNGSGSGGIITVSDIHYKYIKKHNANLNILIDNTANISTNIPILNDNEYIFKAVYTGDNNYNPLNESDYNIKIQGNLKDGSFERINSNTFNINYAGYNNQYVIGILQAKSPTNEIRIPIITDIEGNFTINDIDNWESYVEFNFLKDPKNNDLIKTLKESDTETVYDNLEYYYENATFQVNYYANPKYYETIQFSPLIAQNLYNQFIDNNSKVLFTTYNNVTIYR